MPKWLIITLAVLLVAGLATWWVLSRPNPNVGDATKVEVTYDAATQATLDRVTITRAQLADATCGEGQNCWIAVNGVVRDLAGIPTWARGVHHEVEAGTDATEAFIGSGHARAVLEKLPVVGRLGA